MGGNPVKTDYKTVKVEVKDGVAILALNNPPVNQLSEHFLQPSQRNGGARVKHFIRCK
jgi:hypothetical protein